MTVENIIRSLEDQAKDRESSIDETDPDCIFPVSYTHLTLPTILLV